MEFTLEINSTNAAFDPDPAPEIVRLLRDVANKIEGGQEDGWLHDINGNMVGGWEIDKRA